jgi:hypothetical protein
VVPDRSCEHDGAEHDREQREHSHPLELERTFPRTLTREIVHEGLELPDGVGLQGVRDRAQLVVLAYESGLVRPGWVEPRSA